VISAKPTRTALVLENLRQLWKSSYHEKLGIYSAPTMYFSPTKSRNLHPFHSKITYGQSERPAETGNISSVHLQIVRMFLYSFKTDKFLGVAKIQPYADFVQTVTSFVTSQQYVINIHFKVYMGNQRSVVCNLQSSTSSSFGIRSGKL
jgi:hypothetical protein